MARRGELLDLLRRSAAGYWPGHAGGRCHLTAERDDLADARDQRRGGLERLTRTVAYTPASGPALETVGAAGPISAGVARRSRSHSNGAAVRPGRAGPLTAAHAGC